jgi:hypothetical protein
MSKPTGTIPPKLQAWIQARNRHHLSHAQVQMARELGMNPTRLGSIDNHREEPWKAPLPAFIENLYFKRFDREQPEVVVSIEDRARHLQQQKADGKPRRPAGAPIPASQAMRRDQLDVEPPTAHRSNA